jgi:ubiquinone/menaquinone biosynthesis C-methylase UbiE
MHSRRATSGKRDQATSNLEAQASVNDYFASVASHWALVYQETTLDARIYQDRKAIALQLIERLRLPPAASVLEVGCGAGLSTIALAMRGYHVDALDTVPTMLDLTRQRLLEAGIDDRVRTICADVHQLPIADNSYDLAFALGVLPWLDKPCAAIREMARVTRPAGYVLVTADNRWHLNEMLDPWLNPMMRPVRRGVASALRALKMLPPAKRPQLPSVHRHSRREFDAMLLDAGLDKLWGSTLGFGPLTFFGKQLLSDSIGVKVHRLLQTGADRKLPIIASGGAQYLVIATKDASKSAETSSGFSCRPHATPTALPLKSFNFRE